MCARQAAPFSPPNLSHLLALLSRQQGALVSPLAATLMDPPASVAYKRLTAELTPLDATLTKNRGWGVLWLTRHPTNGVCPGFLVASLPTTHGSLSSCTLNSCLRKKTFNAKPTPPLTISKNASWSSAINTASTSKAK